MTGIDVDRDDVAAGTFCEDTTGESVCGVGRSTTTERQRTRGMRTGAYAEFGNTGVWDVFDSSAMTSGMDSSGTGIGVTGASLDVEGPQYSGSRDTPGGLRSKYV